MPDATAGDPITALYYPPTEWAQDDAPITNISAADYTVGDPEVGVTFFANYWGKIRITVGGAARGGTSGNSRIDLAPQVFKGSDASGDEIIAPSILSRGWSSTDSGIYIFGSRSSRFIGLERGELYYARVVYKKGSAGQADTGDILRREIIVEPVS